MMRLAALFLLACPWLVAESVNLASADLIEEGAGLYAKSCAVGYCHGSEGRSARGPALRDRVWDPRELHRITAEGLPGTSMPAWSGVISDMEIWAVTAYLISLASEPPSGAGLVIEMDAGETSAPPAPLSDEARAGQALFFDLKRQRRCGVCHEVDGMGTAIGPNLTIASRSRSAAELRADILRPNARIAFGYEQVELELHSGAMVRGVLAEETESTIRVYDAASIPLPLRSIPTGDVRRQGTTQRSSMPADLSDVYSSDEIAKIVAFLSEAGR